MKKSELKKSIEEVIIEILSEAGEKTAMVTTQSGETTAVDYKTPDELNKIKDNTDVKSIKTGAGQKIKEAEDDEFDAPEKEPSKAELKKIDKEFNSSKLAKKLSAEDKERLNKLESGIKKKLANPTKDNIAIVRQLINRADVKKLFKDGGKDLKALVSDIIK